MNGVSTNSQFCLSACLGTVTWQLNEIWPTGGWGSVEYGTPVKGQVIGGRWKPLHHWLTNFLFQSLFASCSADNEPKCVIKNDDPYPASGVFYVTMLRFSDGKQTEIQSSSFSIGSGAGASMWLCALDTPNHDGNCQSWDAILKKGGCDTVSDCIILTEIKSESTVIRNFVPLTTPEKMKLPDPGISWEVDGKSGDITLKSAATAAFVTLTTQAQGRFSDNTFIMTPGTKKVQFLWFDKEDIDTLRSTLRVEHAQMYKQ